MRRTLSILVAVLLCSFDPATAQKSTLYDEPLSERRVSYAIDAKLDPDARTVTATQRLTWRNPDSVPINELQFHLYLNAFKNAESTFMKESGGRHRGFSAEGEDSWGSIAIGRMALEDAPVVSAQSPEIDPELIDITDEIVFIQPDDGNPYDETVISVQLPRAVKPGETIALRIDFESKLPRVSARTGWEETSAGEPFFMVAQWFPKIAVYEIPGQRYIPADAPRGEWNAHQFHANSEFYADFGTYRVSMEVPAEYVVGATGILTGEEILEGGSGKRLTYAADDVHDFAWTASPSYLITTDTWRHVTIHALMQPEHEEQAERHIYAAKVSLDRFDKWLGEYPYTTLTVVDAVGGAGGMEYPTLITGFTFTKAPEWLRIPLEMTVVHEFGHQYFYGMLANNEFEEAWLDEGINSYLETKVMDDEWGTGGTLSFAGFDIGSGDVQRLSYTKNAPSRGASFGNSWEQELGTYAKVSYAKPATVLNTLERHLGWDTMQEFLRTYYERWRFRHPTTKDVIDIAEEVSGQELDWFFDQYIYGTAVVDYRVDRIRNRRVEEDSVTTYDSEVRVERAEDGVFPTTLRVTYADGATEDVTWDGQDRWKSFSFRHDSRIVRAEVDPDNNVWLDINRLNNSKVSLAQSDVARELQLSAMTLIQHFFYLISGIF